MWSNALSRLEAGAITDYDAFAWGEPTGDFGIVGRLNAERNRTRLHAVVGLKDHDARLVGRPVDSLNGNRDGVTGLVQSQGRFGIQTRHQSASRIRDIYFRVHGSRAGIDVGGETGDLAAVGFV